MINLILQNINNILILVTMIDVDWMINSSLLLTNMKKLDKEIVNSNHVFVKYWIQHKLYDLY